jgi:Xaa-Pro aminopeptidase
MNREYLTPELLISIIKEKHTQLIPILEEVDIDCWMIFVRETESTPDPAMELAVGGDVVGESAFIFSLKDGILTKTAIVKYFDENATRGKGLWDEVIGYTKKLAEPFQNLMKKLNPKKIALNFSETDVTADGLSHGMWLILQEILADYANRFCSSTKIVNALRGRKTDTEVELITKACELTEVINRSMVKKFQVGMSEFDVQEKFYEEMETHGVGAAWQKQGCPSVDAGPDKELGHDFPRKDLVIQKNHTLHNDFGIRLNGFCSDIQRMWYFGKYEEIPEELHHAFDTVREAIIRASKVIRPGIAAYKVDKAARDYVIERGYEEYMHSLGHQVGKQAHDGGVNLGARWEIYKGKTDLPVEENNVFTLELGVRTKHYGQVSLEEMIVVTKTGCRFLIPPQEKWITVY